MAALVSACAAADSLFVPNLVGQDIYHAHRALRKLGLVSRFEQVKADTAKVPLFFVASQAPDSGAAANPGDTVDFTIRFDNLGLQAIGSVVILDSLSTRLEFVSDSAQCSLEARVSTQPNEGDSLMVRCELLNPLKPGQGGVLRFQCRVR